MMKKFNILIFFMLMSGCLSFDHNSDRIHHVAPYTEVYYDEACYYSNPYTYMPAYCETRWSNYVGEIICCGWKIDGCYYEEWCTWPQACGWQYNENYTY